MYLKTIKVQVTHELSMEDVANIAITAFEGGIGYWCDSSRPIHRTGSGWNTMPEDLIDSWRIDGCGPYVNPKFWEDKYRGYALYQDEAEDGNLTKCPHVLTHSRIQSALTIMSDEYPEALRRIVDEQYDVLDADVAIQIAVLGEVVYG